MALLTCITGLLVDNLALADSPDAQAAMLIQRIGGKISWSADSEPKHIVAIDFDSCRLRLEDVESLKPLEYLEELKITRTRVDTHILEAVAKLTPLKRLSLLRTDATDVGMVYLSQSPQLQELDLILTNVTDEGLGALRRLRTLTTIRLSTKMKGSGLRYLAEFPVLRTVDLSGAGVDNDSLKWLGDIKSLREIDMVCGGPTLDQTGKQNLCRLTGLTCLKMDMIFNDDHILTYSKSLPMLQSVQVGGRFPSDLSIAALAEANVLRELKFFSAKKSGTRNWPRSRASSALSPYT